MFFLTIKSNYRIFYLLLILITLITFSYCSPKPKRFLQSNYYYEEHYSAHYYTNISFAEDPGFYLLGWFIIFFFMGLYIVCSMKNYPEIANRTDDVWKFMFFANNGILVIASINVIDIKNILLDGGPFILSSIVFLIGCFYYICKYIKECSYQKAHEYFERSKLGELGKLPCFVWSLVGLTDPCCRSGSDINIIHSEERVEINCCACLWNIFIFIIGRLAVLFTFLSYYIFYIIYILFWLIAKGIFCLILFFKDIISEFLRPKPTQNNPENNNSPNNQRDNSRVPITNNINIVNIINNKNNINNRRISTSRNNNNNIGLNQTGTKTNKYMNIKNINNSANQNNDLSNKDEVEKGKPSPNGDFNDNKKNTLKENNYNESEEEKKSGNCNNDGNMGVPPGPQLYKM